MPKKTMEKVSQPKSEVSFSIKVSQIQHHTTIYYGSRDTPVTKIFCVRDKAKLEGDRIKVSLLNIEISECIKQVSAIENRIDKLESDISKPLLIRESTQLMNDNEHLYK